MRARVVSVLLALLTGAVLAAPALAKKSDNGEGLLGETNDKIVTGFSMAMIIFFVALAAVASAVQTRLEKRKKEKDEASLRRRVGW